MGPFPVSRGDVPALVPAGRGGASVRDITGPPPASQPAKPVRRLCILILGLLALLPASAAWGTEPDETVRRLRAGLDAIAAARQGDAEAREAHLDRAIASFRSILVNRPSQARARLELARAFFMKGEDRLARRHFERVLAGRPPAPVAANIQRFLQVIRARRQWNAHLSLALAPDSNLNTASDADKVWLDTPFGRLPFARPGDTAPKSGIGLSVWSGGEYQHPLNAHWRLRAGADASVREYKGRRFDSHSAAAYLGPRWLVDPRTEVSLLATAQRNWTAGTPGTDRYGLRLEAGRRLTPRLSVQARAGLRLRNCRDCDRFDGREGEAELGLNWVALPTLRVGGNAGWSWSRAEAKYRRSDGPRSSLVATLALPLGFTVSAGVAMHWTNYEGDGARHRTIDRRPREDRTRKLTISVLNRAVTLFGFSPRVSLVNENNETNAQALDYERNRGELSFVRQF